MTTAEESCERFNAWVREVCSYHPELHVTCPTCGDRMCLYWTDQEGDPEATCSNGHRLFPNRL